jgi:hypothetical protein
MVRAEQLDWVEEDPAPERRPQDPWIVARLEELPGSGSKLLVEGVEGQHLRLLSEALDLGGADIVAIDQEHYTVLQPSEDCIGEHLVRRVLSFRHVWF